MKIFEGDPLLLEVVQEGRSTQLKHMLSTGADVNIRSPFDSSSALHVAAIHGYGRMVSTLLRNGADKDALDDAGETPLIKAAEVGHPKVVEILLAAGADADVLGTAGDRSRAALHFAAGKGHRGMVSTLLSYGADLDTVDGHGYTPLAWAIFRGHLPVVKMLLKAGADLNIRCMKCNGGVALHLAAGAGNSDAISALLEVGADKDVLDSAGETPLIWASASGRVDAAKTLLVADAKVNIRGTHGEGLAAIHVSADHGYAEFVSMLLEHGADKDIRTNRGETPLSRAITHEHGGHLPVVQALLDFDADVTIPTTVGRYTPLLFAANVGQGDIVSALLARGADALVTDDDGLTPLVAAAHEGHYRVYLLMANGTALGDGKADGCFALRHAFHSGHNVVVATLLQRAHYDALDCDGERPLIWAAAGGYLPMVESLVAAGGNVNVRRGSDGCAALHLAAGGGYVGIVSALLRKGAYKDVLDNKGRTPLLYATAEGHQPTVEGLIEAGADCNTRSKDDGFSALHLAAGKGYEEMVWALLGGGADIDAVDHNGDTALMWAAGKGHEFVVEVLLAAGADAGIRNNVEAYSALDWATLEGHVAVEDAILRHVADANASDDGGTDVHLAACTDQADDVTQVVIEEEFDFDSKGKTKTKAVGSESPAEAGRGSFRGMLEAPAWVDVEGILLVVAMVLWFSGRCRLQS